MKKHIDYGQHVYIAGQNGSGKSVLAEVYLSGYEHVVMLDSKNEKMDAYLSGKQLWYGHSNEEIFITDTLKDLENMDTKKYKKAIYSPKWEELNDDYYNAFFKFIYDRKNCIAWVDEAMAVSKNAHNIPEYYKAILTRGRSRKTSVWSCTQRPKGLHSLIASESKYYFVFTLNLPQDRDYLSEITGSEKFLIKPKKYHFWYFEQGQEHPTMATLKIKK